MSLYGYHSKPMDLQKETMGSPTEIIKKNVAAIHTEGKLSLLERKLVNVLLLNAYDDLLTTRTHTIPLKHLYALLSWEYASSLTTLKNALNRLTTTAVEFNLMEDGKEKWEVMSMLSYASIDNGVCTYRYDDSLASRLYDPEIYAKINIGMQRRFDGGYALTLYENCIRYKSVGSTGWWDIEKFRKIIGAESKIYDEFKYLKRNIINLSINEINNVSDILISAEFSRTKRKVTSIKFTIEDNPQQTLLPISQLDQYAEIKETELFRRMVDHGFNERLILTWMVQDTPRVKAVLDYVEDKDRNKKLHGKPAGYIRKLIEEGVDVEKKTNYELAKEAKKVEKAKLLQDQRKNEEKLDHEVFLKKQRVDEVIHSLSNEQIKEYLKSYAQEYGEKKIHSWDEDLGQLTDSIERVSFNAWLRGKISTGLKSKNKGTRQRVTKNAAIV